MMRGWLCLPLVSLGLAQGGGVRFFSGSWEALLQEAQKQNKLIFVDFYAEWCGPCKMLERHTFPNPEVGAYAEKYYLAYRLDAEKGQGPRLANQYKVRAYPTIVFLDPQGNEIGRQVGFLDAPSFLSVLKRYQERFAQKREDRPPSWATFHQEYQVFFSELATRAWQATFSERFTAWQQAVNQGETEKAQQLAQSAPFPANEVLTALYQWHQGQKEGALHTLHHRLYQGQKLSPAQALWIASYALLYWEAPPPEAIQWATFAVKKDPSGPAFLTQAGLYYRLGRLSEAKEALKEARRDLPPDQPALTTLTALTAQKP